MYYKKLDFSGSQNYMALHYHMEEAIIEQKKKLKPNSNPPFAIFSNKYCNEINNLDHNKKYDFCFIGSINSNYENRKWVIDFAKKNFTKKSIFINTDNNTNWKLLGDFDYSNKINGFCPKEQKNNLSKKVLYRIVKENITYFEKMCQSHFVLCPAGDSSWSFRFYEVLMCQSIPIVESWHHTYRTKEEANIKYKYILYNEWEKNRIYIDYIYKNIKLFKKHHLLNDLSFNA